MKCFKFSRRFLVPALITLCSVNGICQSVSKSDSLYCGRVVEPAKFPGGEWDNYFYKHLDTEVPKLNGAPPGIYTAVILFVIGKDGTVKQIKPFTNLGYGMEQEMIRVTRKSPKWLPCKQNGRQVSEFRKQQATFIVPGPAIAS